MAKSIKKDNPVLVKPSLKKPDAEPSELPDLPVSKEEELDNIPEEDDFVTPPYEQPPEGEGP
jgi:hypothetical protein